MRHSASFALALALCACSPGPSDPKAPAPTATPAPAIVPPAPPAPAKATAVLSLEGLGDLRIGEPPPAAGSWAERGAQAGDTCRTITSPDYPGVYAIVEDGKVQRITVGQRSDVKLTEGVAVGSSEAEVRQWFAGFRETPHKYEAAPAKYLTAPNATPTGGSALRFEIDQDGKVRLIHVGLTPVLEYVEGCA